MIATFIEIAPTSLMQSLVLALLVIGVMIPFKFLDFPDLTAEGSYPMGAAVTAALIVLGLNPMLAALIGAILAGTLGLGTAFINIKFNVNTLLAGIIIGTMTYSINLRVMGGPNIALFNFANIFGNLNSVLAYKIIILISINLIVACLLTYFLSTEYGLRFRVVGLNRKFAQKQGININKQIYFGLFVANFLCGLSGALMVQIQGYADIGIGTGIVIYALAGMMLGEKIIGSNNVLLQTIAPIFGSILYGQIQGLALSAGLAPTDLKMLTGLIVLGTIALSRKS